MRLPPPNPGKKFKKKATKMLDIFVSFLGKSPAPEIHPNFNSSKNI